MALSCKLRFPRFSARVRFQDRAECGNKDRLLWEKKPACNWDNVTKSGVSADQTWDLHRKVGEGEVKGVMMPLPELKNDEMDRSQTRDETPPQLRIPDTDRL